VVRRIPIRAKVAGALAVPLLALVIAAGIGVSSNAAQASRVSRQADLATASIGHAGLISALQNERNQATIEMLGLAGRIALEVDDRAEARDQTDAAYTGLHHEIAGQSDRLRADYAEALRSLTDLPDVRAQVDAAVDEPGPGNSLAAHEVFGSYTRMIATLFASHDRFSLVVDDAGIRLGDDLIHYSSHATDAVAQLMEALLYVGSAPGGINEPVEAAVIAELRRDVDKNNAILRTKGTGPYAPATEQLLDNPRVRGLGPFTQDAIESGGKLDAEALLRTTPLGPAGGYLEFRDAVVRQLDARAERLQHDADVRRRLYLGGALLILASALAIALLISRSITRPLRDLSLKARAMATYRLPAAVQDILDAPPGEDIVMPQPEPIVVGNRDEVADVAGALNDVQASALTLAVEQAALRRNIAESYINLGRRNQNLLSRLLDAVGDLERGESDAVRLEQLYKLDHLATRIRRNAESLLVLSDNQTPTRWQPPVPMADVVRAALGEIENYERVLVRTLEPVMIVGGSAADLAHLLAELVENGLRHSPPREMVEVTGRSTLDGYSLAVIDHGLGMTPEDLERANHRLAGTESFTVTPAKYLGHYVTGVLAARHGIKVQLQGSVVVGIAALVDLPPTLLADRSDRTTGLAAPPETAEPPEPAGVGAAGPSWDGERPAEDREYDDGPIERPTAEDVRAAVALIRSRSATSSRRPDAPAPDPAASATATVVPPAPALAGGYRPAVAELGPAAPRRPQYVRATLVPPPGPPPAAPPEAAVFAGAGTATGLQRPRFEAPRAWGPAPAGPDGTVPGRTVSGLVRRVRGSHGPTPGTAGGAPRSPWATPRPPGTPAVDGAEMQRFLTNLASGVQRSLDQQASGPAGGDER
jgi:hypothetical protein